MTKSQSNMNNKRRMIPLSYVVTPIAIIFIAIILVVIVAIFSPKPAKKPVVIKSPLVEVVTLKPEKIRFVVQSQGTVQPRTETTLVAEVSGMVTQVSPKFLVGGFFEKGEWILTLDDAIYQINLTKAQARLATAKASLLEEEGRAQQAKQEWLLTGNSLENAPALALRVPQIEKARADVVSAEADLREAKIRLEKTKIVAPYNAMLKEKRTDVGQYVNAGSQLAVTFAVDYAEVRLPIKKRDLNFLNTGRIDQVEQQLDPVQLYSMLDQKKQTWQSHIVRYEGFVDSKSRVYYAVARVKDPYNLLNEASSHNNKVDLQVGSFVRATIQGKAISAVYAIPRSAISGTNTVYVLDKENKLAILNISVLRSDADYLYSQDSQLADQRIIITKLETPVAGMSLRLANESSNSTQQGDAL